MVQKRNRRFISATRPSPSVHRCAPFGWTLQPSPETQSRHSVQCTECRDCVSATAHELCSNGGGWLPVPTTSPEQTPYAKFGRTGPEPAGLRDCADPDAHVFRTVRRGLCFTGRCCFRSGDVAWLPLSTVVNVGQATSRIPVELGRLTSRDRPRPQTSSGYWRGLRAGSLWTVPT